jgi:hypothetical protein
MKRAQIQIFKVSPKIFAEWVRILLGKSGLCWFLDMFFLLNILFLSFIYFFIGDVCVLFFNFDNNKIGNSQKRNSIVSRFSFSDV